jgi:antitoxin component YwqK of YwqJK toxin-antitoxin module
MPRVQEVGGCGSGDVILDGVTKTPDPIPEVARYADGTVKFTGFRLAGELHGDWEWFRTDGSLMRTGSFDRGKQIGPWRTFDRSGRMVKETMFG